MESILLDLPIYTYNEDVAVNKTAIRNANQRFGLNISGIVGSILVGVLLYFQSKLLMLNNVLDESLKRIDLGLTIAFIEKSGELILRFYILKAEVYQKMRVFQTSIGLYTKALRYAWLLKEVDLELFLYDRVAVCFYYLEDMARAEQVHRRSILGTIEPHFSQNLIQSREGLISGHKLILKQMGINADSFIHRVISIL